jgi:predicted GTPase
VIIVGAAGRDFHNFNVVYRGPQASEVVVAFTAAQIPGIENRRYPASLAGPDYPDGIPINPEERLEELIERLQADEVVFAYSDVSYDQVMQLASRALACGADFRLLGPNRTALRSRLPVVAVCAVRTGAGKSQTARRVVEILRQLGRERVAVLRHPMPYGELANQRVQRFATMEDLDRHSCTLEEREEYEPHLRHGSLVFAGVDYEAITRAAEAEADCLIWDGGNNDLSFLAPDLLITVVDPLRAGHEHHYYPGEVNLLMADVIVINKVDSASAECVANLRRSLEQANPRATLVEAESRLTVDGEKIRGRRVVVVDDGPSLTHGGMSVGAGYVAATQHQAGHIVDPRPFAVGSLVEVYASFPHLGPVLPAMGYSAQQRAELRQTLENCGAELVVAGTPIDLASALGLRLPLVRVEYDLVERGDLLADALAKTFGRRRPAASPEGSECAES